MRVCLISPPKPYLLNPLSCPPLGLMTVASVLKDMGHDVSLIDLNKDDRIPDADLYGISITTPDLFEAIRIKDEIKEQNPDARVIAGGPHATLCSEECAQHFDVVCVGDHSAVEKLNELNGQKIVYGYAKDFDKYHPDRDIVDLWDYKFEVAGVRASTVVFTQSCVWRKCAFCCRAPMPYDRVRLHSVKWCEEELSQIAEKGFRAVQCYDDEFLCFRKRDEQIVRLIPEYIEVWRCFLRADYCLRNKDLVRLAVKNGLREVLIGVESGSEKILKTIEKGTMPKMNLEAIKFLHSLGVKVKAAMIIGLPGESPETLMETWKWLEKAEPYIETFDFTIFVPMPGSKIYEHPDKYDIGFSRDVCYTPYKGYGTEVWQPPKVWTSKLTPEQIAHAREVFERRFKFKEDVILQVEM
ncbi:MAG: B12-binding domain-containing radical SAM protein [Methermicoccaceae archaeon]